MGFFLREALRSLRRNAAPSFAAMATIIVTMVVLGVFIPIVQATTGAANDVRGRVLVDVYLKSGAKDSEIERVRQTLQDRTPHVKRVEFVSKAQALKEQRRKFPDAYDQLGGRNPLPDTFRVYPDSPDNVLAIRDALAPAGTSGKRAIVDPAIDEVRNRKDDTQKILTVTRVVKIGTFLLAGLLIAASILLIANTIRLSLFARRREVEVMKLVGATDWFIRWPFMIEGMIVGAFGALIAVLLLAVGKIAVIDSFQSNFALISAPDTISFPLLIAVLMGSAVLVSALGSGISLRRFLRV